MMIRYMVDGENNEEGSVCVRDMREREKRGVGVSWENEKNKGKEGMGTCFFPPSGLSCRPAVGKPNFY